MSRHTQGPWLCADFGGNRVLIGTPDGPNAPASRIAVVHFCNGMWRQEHAANARLIAAAPELLAACHAVLVLRSLGGMMPGVREVVMVAIEEVEKAIQKATGEEPKC